ncbi:MAG: hypothetical protein HY954_05115 [Deltaproteobacteria bacterium]|nr:hypothetical protein [Deltaproteobacteria bacterium]
MKKILLALLFISMTLVTGCGGINFNEVSPDAKGFSPQTIAVLPATVGEYEASRNIVDGVVSKRLAETGLFENVVDSSAIKTQLADSTDLASSMEGYIQRLNTLGISDAAVAARLKDAVHADAFFLTYVTAWGYGRQEGNKIARVGLGIKLVNSSTGAVVWKANHELTEDYMMLKPDLAKLSEKLLSKMLKEIPLTKTEALKNRKAVPAAEKINAAPAPAAPETKKESNPLN